MRPKATLIGLVLVTGAAGSLAFQQPAKVQATSLALNAPRVQANFTDKTPTVRASTAAPQEAPNDSNHYALLLAGLGAIGFVVSRRSGAER